MCGHKHRRMAVALVIVMAAGLISMAAVQKLGGTAGAQSPSQEKKSQVTGEPLKSPKSSDSKEEGVAKTPNLKEGGLSKPLNSEAKKSPKSSNSKEGDLAKSPDSEAEKSSNPNGMEAAEGSLKADAKSAALIDAGSGQILYEQNAHDKLPPASVTKVMTMLLALEAVDRGQIHLTDQVTISQRAASMGGSQMFMEAGEQQTVETLLKGMAIASANDACVGIAEYVGGTEEIFVENMNKRAKELGMKDTHFVNTNGLPVADHYTSAYDIAIMSRELIRHPQTREWFQTWQTNVTVGLPGKKQTELGLTNTNRLIRLYPGANGIKTGFTQEAGYCLSGSASKGNLTLIAVIMGGSTSKIRFAEAGRLLDYGFATYDSVTLAKSGETLGKIMVDKGVPNFVRAAAPQEINILVRKGEGDQITSKVELNHTHKAPIQAGEQIGNLVVFQGKKEIGRYPLSAQDNVKKAGLLDFYIRMIKSLT